MKYIETKKGSVLSVVVTFFVMLAILSTVTIILLQKEIIYINPKYIVSSEAKQENNLDNENNNTTEKIDLSQYEGLIKGEQLRNLVQDVINNQMNEISIYISENKFDESEATVEKASLLIISNSSITNSEEYSYIQNVDNYKVIFGRNSANAVEKIFVIKINNNI